MIRRLVGWTRTAALLALRSPLASAVSKAWPTSENRNKSNLEACSISSLPWAFHRTAYWTVLATRQMPTLDLLEVGATWSTHAATCSFTDPGHAPRLSCGLLPASRKSSKQEMDRRAMIAQVPGALLALNPTSLGRALPGRGRRDRALFLCTKAQRLDLAARILD